MDRVVIELTKAPIGASALQAAVGFARPTQAMAQTRPKLIVVATPTATLMATATGLAVALVRALVMALSVTVIIGLAFAMLMRRQSSPTCEVS